MGPDERDRASDRRSPTSRRTRPSPCADEGVKAPEDKTADERRTSRRTCTRGGRRRARGGGREAVAPGLHRSLRDDALERLQRARGPPSRSSASADSSAVVSRVEDDRVPGAVVEKPACGSRPRWSRSSAMAAWVANIPSRSASSIVNRSPGRPVEHLQDSERPFARHERDGHDRLRDVAGRLGRLRGEPGVGGDVVEHERLSRSRAPSRRCRCWTGTSVPRATPLPRRSRPRTPARRPRRRAGTPRLPGHGRWRGRRRRSIGAGRGAGRLQEGGRPRRRPDPRSSVRPPRSWP